jgi:hypothetical protein
VQECVIDDENHTTICIGTINVGDGAGSYIAKDVGVVELGMAIIAAGDERGGKSMPDS